LIFLDIILEVVKAHRWSGNLEPLKSCFKGCIITNFKRKTNTWLNFHLNGNGTEWIEKDIPTPTYLEHLNKGYIIAYCLNGFFGTQKGSIYLNDIIARFILTFADLEPYRVKEEPNIKPAGHYSKKIYKLKELQALKSLNNKRLIPTRAEQYHDYTFWAIKLFCEDLIKSQGIATYQQLEDFAYSNFEKECSTLRAKCRSIFNWYEVRDFKISGYKRKMTKKEYEMTRRERALENNRIRKERAKLKVLDATTGLMQNNYKKVNGSWNISKIAKELNMSVNTVKKYINKQG